MPLTRSSHQQELLLCSCSRAPRWGCSPFLCEGRRQGYSSSLILSTGGKGLLQHPISRSSSSPAWRRCWRSYPSLCLLPAGTRCIISGRRQPCFPPPDLPEARGSFDQGTAICTLITAFPARAPFRGEGTFPLTLPSLRVQRSTGKAHSSELSAQGASHFQ